MKWLLYIWMIIWTGSLVLFFLNLDIVENTYLQWREKNQVILRTEKAGTGQAGESSARHIIPAYRQEANMIINVPLIQQMPELPRGCEVTSLAMLLHFHGLPVSKMELAERIVKQPFQQGGYKGNMHEGFVGDMTTYDRPGLGVYVEPVIDLVSNYIHKEQIVNISGKQAEDIYHYLDNGLPVWVIINSRMKKLPAEQFETWKTNQGNMKVTYRQHSVIITGHDKQYVYVNNPLKHEKNSRVNKKDFEAAWIQMGRQAMTITSP